tara:strand:+ start:13573 stop:14457 length:885 start_codon:yes stop_codon:yes gene_type:complete
MSFARTSLLLALTLALPFSLAPSADAAPRAAAARAKAPAKAKAKTKAATKPRTARTAAKTTLKKTAKEFTPKQAVARTKRLAGSYAKEHGFPTRVVKTGPKGQEIDRIFVPILPGTHESFQNKFTAKGGNGSVILRHTPNNKHLAMAVEPGDLYLWGQNYNGTTKNTNLMNQYMNTDGTRSNWPGSSIVVHPTNIKTLKGFLTETAKGPRCDGHCMIWLPNAPTGPNKKTLFHDLGITRSRDGDNMKAKIVHAGNHRVGVVGIHVTSIEQFNAMTPAQLVGPVPTAGVEAAVRP